MKFALLRNFLIWDKWSYDPFHRQFIFYTCFMTDDYGNKYYKPKVWWGPEKFNDFLKCFADKRLRKDFIIFDACDMMP